MMNYRAPDAAPHIRCVISSTTGSWASNHPSPSSPAPTAATSPLSAASAQAAAHGWVPFFLLAESHSLVCLLLVFIHATVGRHLGLPCLFSCKWRCDELRAARIFLNERLCFLGMNTQESNCWVIWLMEVVRYSGNLL